MEARVVYIWYGEDRNSIWTNSFHVWHWAAVMHLTGPMNLDVNESERTR